MKTPLHALFGNPSNRKNALNNRTHRQGSSIASPITIRRATSTDLSPVLNLLERYYTEWDIWHRDGETAVRATLEKKAELGYFIATAEVLAAGCVLCKPLPSLAGAVECKRLYVAPEFRGHRLASQLMDVAEAAAQSFGADWMYLDTKPEFAAAIALYRSRGYFDCPRYNDNAQATIFLRKGLRA